MNSLISGARSLATQAKSRIKQIALNNPDTPVIRQALNFTGNAGVGYVAKRAKELSANLSERTARGLEFLAEKVENPEQTLSSLKALRAPGGSLNRAQQLIEKAGEIAPSHYDAGKKLENGVLTLLSGDNLGPRLAEELRGIANDVRSRTFKNDGQIGLIELAEQGSSKAQNFITSASKDNTPPS